ncbi:MAG: PDZ domain-containing protein [Labilithrix sp.]|nr:PDZ domain-containing protein [Labilithrix sp.]MCW5812354.1 PDZ domain-containing protein [Labilithrix sp.]
MGALLLLLTVLLHGVTFVALRWLVARRAGVRGMKPVLAIDHAPWSAVSLARRVLFTAVGPFGCYLVTALLLTFGLLLTGETRIDETSMRVRVAAASPAAAAGFRDGDQILRVDGAPVHDWDTLKREVAARPETPVLVAVRRGEEELTLTPTPSAAGKIGVGPWVETRPVGIGSALARGVVEPFAVVRSTVIGWGRVVRGSEHELSGPIGIAAGTSQAYRAGAGAALRLLGGLSAYGLVVPFVVALVFFPRSRRR